MLLTVIYIIAITAEAMTGALSAGRRSMDWFGVVLIACVTALGGGSVRCITWSLSFNLGKTSRIFGSDLLCCICHDYYCQMDASFT